jgi:hypothetical protein
MAFDEFNQPVHIHKTETKTDVTEIIKTLVDVSFGMAHNRQLLETLKILIEYQNSSRRTASPEARKEFMEFFERRFVIYLQTLPPKEENLLSWLFPNEEADPRMLAWEDTAKFVRFHFLEEGIDPQTLLQQRAILDQAIANLAHVIQSNTLRKDEREKVEYAVAALSQHAESLGVSGSAPAANEINVVESVLNYIASKRGE